MWAIGDWLNYGERRYGETFAQGVNGYSVQTQMNAKWVSSRYEFSMRIENLSFTHHQIVAALPIEERKQPARKPIRYTLVDETQADPLAWENGKTLPVSGNLFPRPSAGPIVPMMGQVFRPPLARQVSSIIRVPAWLYPFFSATVSASPGRMISWNYGFGCNHVFYTTYQFSL